MEDQCEDEAEDEMKQEANEENEDTVTEVEENDIRTAAPEVLVLGDLGQDRGLHHVKRGDFSNVDGLGRRCHDRGQIGRIIMECWSAAKTNGNKENGALLLEDGGNGPNATSIETCKGYGKNEDESESGKLPQCGLPGDWKSRRGP